MNRRRIALTTLGLGLLVSTAAAASAPPTAVRIRAAQHPPANVQFVVDFSRPVRGNQVEAVDPEPADGAARLKVDGAVTRALTPVRFRGVSARASATPHGIQVRLSMPRRGFDHLGYTVLRSPARLAIALWRSSPPLGAPIRRGAGGCLTLGQYNVGATSLATSGREKVFEHQFMVRLKDATGRVLAARHVTGTAGRWHTTASYTRPVTRYGTLEAFEGSAKDGALSCLVHVAVRFP